MPPKQLKTSKPSNPPSLIDQQTQEAQDFIEVVGITGLNGYINETNQCIGLCKNSREDNQLLMIATRSLYRRKDDTVIVDHSRNRIRWTCQCGNYIWFNILFSVMNKSDIPLISDCTVKNEYSDSRREFDNYGLYHLLCTITKDLSVDPEKFNQSVEQRVTILRTLQAYAVQHFDAPKAEGVSDPREALPFYISRSSRSSPTTSAAKTNPTSSKITFNFHRDEGYGKTPLILACENQMIEMVKAILEDENHCDILINHPSDFGKTALHIAVKTNNPKIVGLLCQSPHIDINQQDGAVENGEMYPEDLSFNGDTPLSLAVKKGYIEVIDELLKYADRLNPNLHDGFTASSAMASGRSVGPTALHKAIWKNDPEIVRRLLTIPTIDPNVEDENGYNPLHLAVAKNSVDGVKVLCQAPKIDLNAVTGLPRQAEEFGYWDEVPQGFEPFTPLHMAVKKSFVEIIRVFAEPSTRDRIDWNLQNIKGNAALHIVAAMKETPTTIEILEILCNIRKVKKTMKNAHGRTPLEIAQSKGNTTIANLLSKN